MATMQEQGALWHILGDARASFAELVGALRNYCKSASFAGKRMDAVPAPDHITPVTKLVVSVPAESLSAEWAAA